MGQNGTRNRTAGVLILGSIRQGLKFWAPICEGLFDLEARVWLFFMVITLFGMVFGNQEDTSQFVGVFC